MDLLWMEKRIALLKICGICGVLAPIIAFTCISLSIASSRQFSWTENALSDLGVQADATAISFNSGLIIGGIFTLAFALGLLIFLNEKLLGKIGAYLFVLDALALIAIGFFPENIKPTHYYVSVAFFILSPISILIICATFLLIGKVKMGLFTFLTAIVAIVVWMIQFTIKFGSNVAIPETISALSASIWSLVLGFQMFKQASRSNK
jgi:hypothetical membrane protein